MCVKNIRILFSACLLFLKEGVDSFFRYIFIFIQYNKNQAKLSKLLCHDKIKYTRYVIIKTHLRS